MLNKILATKYRQRFVDSFGGGWVYYWFCMDHVGFSSNPRKRDLGYHNIFDRYSEILRKSRSSQDGLHFHHHPVPFSLEAHRPSTNYLSFKPTIVSILARRLIDRQWFPQAYRPGFHALRPDSHWFLEQYIPFHFCNQAKTTSSENHFICMFYISIAMLEGTTTSVYSQCPEYPN